MTIRLLRSLDESNRCGLHVATTAAVIFLFASGTVVATAGSGQTSFVPGPPGAVDSSQQAKPALPAGTKLPAAFDAKDRALEARVEERWAAVIKRDFAKAYGFETPDYKKKNSARQYAGKFGDAVDWHKATVKTIRYDRPNEADVVVSLDYSFELPRGEPARTTGDIHDRWVLVDGQWWRRNLEEPLGGGNHPIKSHPKK
jgi:hypothetical protein